MRDFYRPGRSLAVARNGMAATSHPLATLVALDVLRDGGSAADAAIAAAAMQCVVEPCSTGIGGDGFIMASRAGGDDIWALNGSGRASRNARLDKVVPDASGAIARQSGAAVTVPGVVEGWGRLHAAFGRKDFGSLLQPAIKAAREGYCVAPRVAFDWQVHSDILRKTGAARRVFLPNDRPPNAGDVHRQAELADTLSAIAEFGPEEFYRGSIADDIVSCLQEFGGDHDLADFADASGEVVKTISTTYEGHEIHECPPNGQGIVALIILNILKRAPKSGHPLDFEWIWTDIQAARLAYSLRDLYVADPRNTATSIRHLLSDELADDLYRRIIANSEEPVALPPSCGDDTICLSVVDKDRNAVSLINSLFVGFGSGIVAPRSGVLLNNRGQGFSLTADHPNAYGPLKRPLTTIIPAMVSKDGRLTMSFGVMGGQYQAMGHSQFLSRTLGFGLDLQSALDLPRYFPVPGTKAIDVEPTLSSDIRSALEAKGAAIQVPAWPIGGGQAIAIDWQRNLLLGGSDFRKDGLALGY